MASTTAATCHNCGGTELSTERGDSVCVRCGSVVADACMVSDVEFQENSAGASSIIGQFVSSERQNFNISGGKYGMRDHRQLALDNGKNLLNIVGSQIKMSQHCRDSAFMFFKMASSKRFTIGRKTMYVVGACLYLVSRTEKTPHMLLDIADAIQGDVVTLGRVFLALARSLCIDVPIVDPSLYIHRFAHQLDFGGRENEVSLTALRILARMKKDWIHFGRRPSALSGAALIIAGKLYNFNVKMEDIVKLVRMSKTTVFKRLMDFSRTATGKLTTDEFKTVDLEEEADPPCYTSGRQRIQFVQQLDSKLHNTFNPQVLSQVVKTQEQLEVLLDTRQNINEEISKSIAPDSAAFDYRKQLPKDYSLYSYELDENGQFKIPKHIIDEPDDAVKQSVKREETRASEHLLMEDKIKKREEQSEAEDEESGELDIADIDDEEIEGLLLTEKEIKIKTEIWLEENKEYLQKQKEKEEEKRLKEEEDEKNGVKKKKKYRPRVKKERAGTADEAIQTMLVEKKFSSKINYDVLSGLSSNKPMDQKPQLLEQKPSLLVEQKPILKKEQPVKSEVAETTIYESGPLKRPNKRPTINLSAVHKNAKQPKVEEVEEKRIEDIQQVYDDVEDEEEKEEEEDIVTASSLFAKDIDEFDQFQSYDDEGFY